MRKRIIPRRRIAVPNMVVAGPASAFAKKFVKEIICAYCSGSSRKNNKDCPICEARGHVRLASEDQYICSSCKNSAKDENGTPCHVCHGIGRLDANRQPIKIYKWNVAPPVATVIPGLTEAIQRALQPPPPPSPAHPQLISPSRIEELRACAPTGLDFTKVIRLCEEANTNYEGKCYAAVAMLTRAILDHVPPIFGQRSFDQVVANYPGGRSFKDAMEHLKWGVTQGRGCFASHADALIRGAANGATGGL